MKNTSGLQHTKIKSWRDKHLKGTLKVVAFATAGTLNVCPWLVLYCTMKQWKQKKKHS